VTWRTIPGKRKHVAMQRLVAVLAVLATACATTHSPEQELLEVEGQWARAIVSNDASSIARFLDDDWTVVEGAGTTVDRTRFLGVIGSGMLTHDTMKLSSPHVRVYGNSAIVTARIDSRGKYAGQRFSTNEISTDVFVKRDGQWRCVLTQLTASAVPEAAQASSGQ
jgi:ketosteroid isomerase-like protein